MLGGAEMIRALLALSVVLVAIGGAYLLGRQHDAAEDAQRRLDAIRERQEIPEGMADETDDGLAGRITDGLGGLW